MESNRINVLVCQHCWNVHFTVVEDKILATVCLPVSKSLFTVYLCGSLSINTFATIKTCTVHTLKNSHKATQQRQYLKEERREKKNNMQQQQQQPYRQRTCIMFTLCSCMMIIGNFIGLLFCLIFLSVCMYTF